jgi:magnesium-transporting ATPase (P-type)
MCTRELDDINDTAELDDM